MRLYHIYGSLSSHLSLSIKDDIDMIQIRVSDMNYGLDQNFQES
jgi:hypothetical protein